MSIVRNSAWNVLGAVIPSIFAIPSLAVYSRTLGVELLGLLTLTFAIVGYASSFDFGLSRALIRQVSIHNDDVGMVKVFMGTTSVFVSGASLAIAAIIWASAAWMAGYLRVSPANVDDAISSFRWLSLSVPPYLLSLVGTAYFEGKEDFKTLNLMRSAAGALNAIAGVAFVFWMPTLAAVMAALCLSRFLSCIAIFTYYRADVNRRDALVRPALMTFDKAALRKSLSYGGWLTVSNVVGPVMMYFDRFVLSHFAGAKVVAFYTLPAEVISRLALLPASVSKALFPRLSKGKHTASADRRIGLQLTLICAALTILPTFAFAGAILRFWMGPEFGIQPATVLRILLVGFFFNSLAFSPFTDLQARGHSKTTAGIHAAELLPYVGALVLLTHLYGIIGTAIAWSARMAIDYLIMQTYSRRLSGTKLQ
jgi:O-antigen/teichoic acid export membrane protein